MTWTNDFLPCRSGGRNLGDCGAASQPYTPGDSWPTEASSSFCHLLPRSQDFTPWDEFSSDTTPLKSRQLCQQRT